MQPERALRIFGAGTGLFAAVFMFSSEIFRIIQVPAVSHSSTIAAAIVESQRSTFAGTYLLMLGVFFFIFFIGYLRGRSFQHSDGVGWLANTASAGA